ncbi:MAG: hypothetical protein JOY79_05020 [Acidobacteriaceae bacterium]|nr:hypothetical protein [Acidobacteriaceae bacterium]
MFEDEIALEQKSSNVVPLLLILALVAAIVGSAAYFYLDSKKTLTQQEATTLVDSLIKAQAPATVHFHAGLVKPSIDERPRDPHYRFLERTGFVKLADQKRSDKVQVSLTPLAEATFIKIPDVIKQQEKDGTTSFTVPLARRKLVQVAKVTMKTPQLAHVDYTWQWEPTAMGNVFDASTPEFGKLATWDRATLIQKYGADYYHAQPQTASIEFVRGKQGGWKIYNE